MTMRSIEAHYEYDEDTKVEFDILLSRLDEAAAGEDVYVLAGVLSAMLVECVMQIDDVPDADKGDFIAGAIYAAMQDHAQSSSTMQ